MALEPVPAMPPLAVVAHDDPGTADSLRHAVETATGWRLAVADPSPAGIAGALGAGASVALVGCALLADLPAGSHTPVIAIGDDDRPADVRAALAAGARSLLAWPDGAADLPGELARVAATAHPQTAAGVGGLVVAVRGVQGGAGTTTIAAHLAAAWARWGPAPVLLVDLAGGLAFRLDLSAAPTWSTFAPPAGPPTAQLPVATARGPLAGGDVGDGTLSGEALAGAGAPVGRAASHDHVHVLDSGDPIDAVAVQRLGGADPIGMTTGELLDGDGRTGGGPFLDQGILDGMVAEPWAGLAVLPLAGLADGVPDPPPAPEDVQDLLEAARRTYRMVVVDLPATDGPAIRAALSQADALAAVGRCETAGVRGLQAALAGWQATGHDPETAGAVVTGVRAQAPLASREVRGALGDRLWALIPAAAPELAAAAEDGVLLLDRHDLPAVQAMLTLANQVVPFEAVPA